MTHFVVFNQNNSIIWLVYASFPVQIPIFQSFDKTSLSWKSKHKNHSLAYDESFEFFWWDDEGGGEFED